MPLLITTETRAVTLRRYVTQYQPDSGVAGTEILGGSRDLQSLTNRMPLDVATQLTQECNSAQRS